MTFKEAKKLLEKEGFTLRNIGKTCEHVNGSFLEYEYPEVVSAVNVVSAAGYDVSMEVSLFEERKARLKEKYGTCVCCSHRGRKGRKSCP